MLVCILFAIYFNIILAADILENICGRPSIQPSLSKKGVREEAIPHSWPWQVSLQMFRKGKLEHICGGTIIAPNKVLSRSGCADKIFDFDNDTLRVVVGKHNVLINEATEKLFFVKNISIFDGDALIPDEFYSLQMRQALMVLTLSSNLIFNDNIMPICLSRHGPLPNSTCYVTGWNGDKTISRNDDGVSKALEQINVPADMSSTCQYKPIYGLTELKYMCYSNPTKGFPCGGAHGGPFICKSSNGIWYQYGIIDTTSNDILDLMALKCPKDKTYYFPRISFYLDWIQKQIYGDINDPICGKPAIQPVISGQESDKILDGEIAKPHSWPWQVSLQTFENANLNHICGGTIIAKNKILCAAHCLTKFGMNEHRYEIVVGQHDRYVNEPTSRVFNIKSFSIPNGFDWDKNLIPDDIMVITLTEELMYNQYTMPVCLTKHLAAVGTTCYVTGWGQNVSETSVVTSAVLRQVDIPIQDSSLCKNRDIHGTIFNDTKMLCAGHREGGKDSCQGDSGGPLICKESNIWYQVGIVSTGIGCGQKDKPGVYTSVSYYYDWLQKQIHDNVN